MSFIQKLKKLNLPDDAMVTLTYEDGCDVVHYNETHIDTAISETSVIEEFASVVSNSRLKATNRWTGEILSHMRDEGYLDDYERGSFAFEEYIADTIRENFYDVELIDHTTEQYDHKRGFTTLTAEIQVPVKNLIEESPFISGWTVSVETEDGKLSFEV